MASKDLDIDQLATYLHTTPSKVQRLIDRGKLPARKVGGQWKVAEAVVHTWLEEQLGMSESEDLDQMQRIVNKWSDDKREDISLCGLLPVEAIDIPLSARTRSSVIRRITSLAESTGLLWDAAKMTEAILAREELHPTALDEGVALLHPRRPQASILAEPLIALGITVQPLPFGNQSGHLTDVFFLICSTDDRVHLQVLTKLSKLLTLPDFLTELRESVNAKEAHATIGRFESMLDEVQ